MIFQYHCVIQDNAIYFQLISLCDSGQCYLFSTGKYTWLAAQSHCLRSRTSQGQMYLPLILRGEAEGKFLSHLIQSDPRE